MNEDNPKPYRTYLLGGLLLISVATFLGVFWLNQSFTNTTPVPVTFPDSDEALIPTRLPREIVTLSADSIIQAPLKAEDFNPIRLEIEQAQLDVPVKTVALNSEGFVVTPSDAAGYWISSVELDQDVGNIVIVGHNKQEPVIIFYDLAQVEVNAEVVLTDTKAREYQFRVSEKHIIQVAGAPDDEAARVVELMTEDPEDTQFLTLVSCHPSPDCSSRVIIRALPIIQNANN